MSGGMDNSPTPAPGNSFSDDPSGWAITVERLGQMERRLDKQDGLLRENIAATNNVGKLLEISNAKAAEQLAFMARKEEREIEALKREEARRDMSKEAAAKRLEEDLAERRANRGWMRTTADRALVPFIASVLGGMGTLITGFVAWSLLKLGVSP